VHTIEITRGPLLSVDAEVRGNAVALRARGLLAGAVRSLLERANKMFAAGNPISASDERLVFSTWLPPIPGGPFRRLIRAQLRRELLHRPTPEQVSVGVTDRCPNRCLHCAAEGMARGELLTDDELNSVIAQSIALGSYLVTFDGGEPLLRRTLPRLAAAVPEEKAVTASFTSGYGLTPSLARGLKSAGLYALRVSVDFPERKEHDRFRGRAGSFEDACKAVRTAADAGIHTDMFVVAGPYNIDRLDDFYSLASRLGVDEMSITEIVAVGRWSDRADEVLTGKDVSRLGDFESRVNRRGELPRVTSVPTMMGPQRFGCFAGRRWLHVSAAGDVMPCSYVPLSAGNVREKSLKAIWSKMTRHPAFRAPAEECMMRDPDFRRCYIDTIPENGRLPHDLFYQ